MSIPIATEASVLAPISPDWTIAELVEWLADDSRQHDVALQHPLALIERAVTGETWIRTPSTVALVRSLTSAARTHGAVVIADLTPFESQFVPLGGTSSGTNRDRKERMPEPQVA